MIIKVINQRPWFRASSRTEFCNLWWQETNFGLNFSKLHIRDDKKRCYNHYEANNVLTNKDNLFKNLYNFCKVYIFFYIKKKNLNTFDYVPLTFVFDMRDTNFNTELQNFCKFFISIEKNISIEKVKGKKNKKNNEIFYDFDQSFKWDNNKKNNRNENNNKKNKRNDNCNGFYGIKIINLGFKNVLAEKAFKQKLNKNLDSFFSKDSKNMWLLKPSNMCRGIGLQIFNSLKDLKSHLIGYYKGYFQKNSKNSKKYIFL